MATRVGAGCTFPSSLRSRSLLGRLEIYTRAPRLRETNGYGLLRGARPVLAFTDVVDLFTHELTGLSASSLSLSFVPAGPLDRLLLRHMESPVMQTAS
jgi:hypothetical protein